MQEPHVEGIANHNGPESCEAFREGRVEALTGGSAGQPLSFVSYLLDALGRRIGKTVDGTTTFYLPAGAQTVVEIDRPALPPSQADIDGAQADGALANLAEAPASGGILPGAAGTVTRINFQPATTATPAGFIRDTGKAAAVRTNGLTYGWSADVAGQAVVRGGAVPLMEFDTFIQAQTDTTSASWSIALPNGTYPVVVVAGDALSTEQTNHLLIGGVFREDLTPSVLPGYQAGNFDGYALEVTVTDGILTIAPGSGAYHAKLCFVEIGAAGPPGTLITPEITATLAARIAQANAQTGANPIVRNGQREYFYGSYIDDAVAFVQTVGGVSQRYYPHNNHLHSVAVLTNAAGDVVERYAYTAYGKQTRTVMPGKVVTAFGRGYTGYVADNETSLMCARSRMYGPLLGRFISRDALGYVDGPSMYVPYFVPNGVDALGFYCDPNAKDKRSVSITIGGVMSWMDKNQRAATLADVVGIAKDSAGPGANSSDPACSCVNRLMLHFHSSLTAASFWYQFEIDEVARSRERIRANGKGGQMPYLPPLPQNASRDLTQANEITNNNVKDFGSSLSSNICFCKPCTIFLLGCHAGLAKGIMRGMAQSTGCTVHGPNGYLVDPNFVDPFKSVVAAFNYDWRAPGKVDTTPGANAGWSFERPDGVSGENQRVIGDPFGSIPQPQHPDVLMKHYYWDKYGIAP